MEKCLTRNKVQRQPRRYDSTISLVVVSQSCPHEKRVVGNKLKRKVEEVCLKSSNVSKREHGFLSYAFPPYLGQESVMLIPFENKEIPLYCSYFIQILGYCKIKL